MGSYLNVTVNGIPLSIEKGYTVLQACEQAGIEIPRFCYHERLAIAGNCRMCLVEVEGGPPKPVASCAMPAAEGMVIHTDTPRVKKAREGVLEFLLINHPLDCPICDQGGECDLQDQTMAYGREGSRYEHNKRAYPSTDFGPLIATYLNRCIHCTRCIRFLTDVAGVEELGAFHRGEDMEISTYIEKSVTSELSGNIIDLCPVGALTSKPYAFKARPWELAKTESIDVLDAVGSAIRVDSRGKVVMRILPRLNEEINEEWISDKTRFAYDGLQVQRLDRPYIKKEGKLINVSWEEALQFTAEQLTAHKNKVCAIAGPLADCESMYLLKVLLNTLGAPSHSSEIEVYFKNRFNYLFNTGIQNIEKSDVCLLIGSNPKLEAPIINLRLRRITQKGGKIANIGEPHLNSTYPILELGDSPHILQQLLNGEVEFAKSLEQAKRPALIIGESLLYRSDSQNILDLILKICYKYSIISEHWNGYNVLHRFASSVGALDLGFPTENMLNTHNFIKEADLVYLLGADEVNSELLQNKFVIYQGHHGDKSASLANIILPAAAYTEKDALYINTEGRVQSTSRAVYPPGAAKVDWEIIKMLANYLNIDLKIETHADILKALESVGEQFKHIGHLVTASFSYASEDNEKSVTSTNAIETLSETPISFKKFNFYMTDPISRASKVMAACSKKNGTYTL